MTKLIFSKKSLHLNEGNNNTDSIASVKPSSNSITSVAADLTKSRKENPTAGSFDIDSQNYDGNPSNDKPIMAIDAQNPMDAADEINKMMKRPEVRKTKPFFRVNYNESCVTFSKKEIKDLLK